MKNSIFWTSHSTLLRNTEIEGFLVNIEPIHVGTGKEPPLGATVDQAFIRISYKEHDSPYIPGSSLKGLFRSYATAIAKNKGMDACSGLAKQTCMDIKSPRNPDFGEISLGSFIEKELREGNTIKAMEEFYESACLMCKVFGSPSYAGRVFFEDAYPIDREGKIIPFRFGARTGIAIDRRTGAVMGHALYTVEYVEPGARFKMRIKCANIPNYALGILAMVLRMIDRGEIKIGGFKSRGFGSVRIEDLRFRNKDFPETEETKMRSLPDKLDREVDLSSLVKLEKGWLVAEGEKAWSVLEKLEEAWNLATPAQSP